LAANAQHLLLGEAEAGVIGAEERQRLARIAIP
jgi:hypothetical protein